MNYDAVIFDLDETLMPEYPAVEAAFAEACKPAVTRHSLDATALAEVFRRRGRELWRKSPSHEWCQRIGISSWEGLSGDFSGDGEELTALRQWMERSRFRTSAWRRALADFGIKDHPLADHLADRIVAVRRKHHSVYPETPGVLERLRGSHRLAMLTNGAPRVQRDKIEATGLERYFDLVVISGEVGIGKPDAGVFDLALSRLGVEAPAAVMIGDSLGRDIAGARNAGLGAIWVNRTGAPPSEPVQPDHEVANLTEVLNLV